MESVVRLIKFGLVGATGLVVNQAVLWAATDGLGFHYLLSAVIASQISTLSNFALAERFVFDGRPDGRIWRLFWFSVMNNLWLVARLPFLYLLTDRVGMHYLLSNLIVLTSSTLLRFLISDRWIWGERQGLTATKDPAVGGFSYDIHGILWVSSCVALPELDRFSVERLPGPADLTIAPGSGFGGSQHSVEKIGTHLVLNYSEFLRGAGFAFRAQLNDQMKVEVSWLLTRSPHVLYTNVVEPMLRWLFVEKGYALVHGACLDIDGRGVLITAKTDTGKTTTCLKSIQTHGSSFLSDDMVIITPEGRALSYPKPLTISFHTLKAISNAPLALSEKVWLQFQSRVHSRLGRRFGFFLSALNLPVATMNAFLQILVPPPKFSIEYLVPGTAVTTSIDLTHMVSIEKGEPLIQEIQPDEASQVLRVNTEDAYGFPPYPVIAAALANGSIAVEDKIRRSMVENLISTRLTVTNMDWWERLPRILQEGVAPTS